MSKIIANLFTQSALLFIAYALLALLGAVKFLGNDPLSSALPYHQVAPWSAVLLRLAIMSGLLASGLKMFADSVPSDPLENAESASQSARILNYTAQGWTVFVIVAFLFGALGLLDGRYGMELPVFLSIIQAILMALFVSVIAINARPLNHSLAVWLMGMFISTLCTFTTVISPSDPLQAQTVATVAAGVNLNVAHMVAAAAILFWLLGHDQSAQDETAVYLYAGTLAVTGALVTLAPLNLLSANSAFLSVLTLIAAAGAAVIFIRWITISVKQAAGWVTLAAFLLLCGLSILGGFSAVGSISRWTLGTRLSDLQVTLISLAVMTLVLAMNEAYENKTRTNRAQLPFWLISGGILIAGFGLAGAGLVQTYLERIVGVGYLETQTYIQPLYAVWTLGLVALLLGAVGYTLSQVFRRT